MINHDTVELLKECNAGVKMGVAAIDEVCGKVDSPELKARLLACKASHERLGDETRRLLNEADQSGKEPPPVAKAMSWIKTNAMMTFGGSDETIAGLITDGCNMGVKSLGRYLNQYKAAGEQAKSVTKRLIAEEKRLVEDIQRYL